MGIKRKVLGVTFETEEQENNGIILEFELAGRTVELIDTTVFIENAPANETLAIEAGVIPADDGQGPDAFFPLFSQNFSDGQPEVIPHGRRVTDGEGWFGSQPIPVSGKIGLAIGNGAIGDSCSIAIRYRI